MTQLNLSLDEINGYKDTTITILHKQIGILSQLDEILAKEEAISQTPKKGILTLKTSAEFKEILKNEIKKLENFDVVLAVVGTMKAGKSTTINAIVGREILPNRNRPMTALPTLICHNPEKIVPSIKINPAVLNEFLRKLKSKLSLITNTDGMHQDMLNLIDFIKKNGQFKSYYESEEDIFNFLYQLNDLVRLSKIIEELDTSDEVIKFPFDEYKNFENLPMIEVAFKLDSNFKTQGRFMLLDTAGPNEAGQDELKEALAQQLERSSAVMIVLDYTQLNSDAEKDVKEQIDKIPTVQKSRLFALVNKFDQKNANADEADATRQHIFHKLLKDKIELDNIYAISAQGAYLANRMKSYIALHGNTPEYKPKTWVEDIAKKMFGEMAEDDYEEADIAKIEKRLDRLMVRSRMAEPMDNVIVNMQRNAPFIAMQSALAGASHVFDNLHNTLDIRGFFAEKENLSTQEIEHLKDVMESLRAQTQYLESAKNDLNQKIQDIQHKISTEVELEQKIQAIQTATQAELNVMFDHGSKEAKKQLQDLEQSRRNIFKKIFTLVSEEKDQQERAKLDELRAVAQSNGNKLIFSNEKNLNNFKDEINIAISKLVNGRIKPIFSEILTESIALVRAETSALNTQAQNVLKDLKHDFSEEGINLRINFDAVGHFNTESFKITNVDFKINEKSHTETKNQEGWFGGTKRLIGGLFGADWGTYEINYKTYEVNKAELVQQYFNAINKQIIDPSKQDVNQRIAKLLQLSTDYIDGFGQKIDEIINEMQQGIEHEQSNLHQSQTEKETYKKLILATKRAHEELTPDWEKIAEVFKVEAIKTNVES